MSVVVASIVFSSEGPVLVTYMDEVQDIRNRGLLVQTHQIEIAPGDDGRDYGDEIQDVKDAVMRLLKDALEDFATTPPSDPANERSQD